jgi:hypothetical protein
VRRIAFENDPIAMLPCAAAAMPACTGPPVPTRAPNAAKTIRRWVNGGGGGVCACACGVAVRVRGG